MCADTAGRVAQVECLAASVDADVDRNTAEPAVAAEAEQR